MNKGRGLPWSRAVLTLLAIRVAGNGEKAISGGQSLKRLVDAVPVRMGGDVDWLIRA